MKKIISLIITITLSIQLLNASCITDGRSWSEIIFNYNGNHRSAVFTCKILEFSAEKGQETTAGYIGLKAVAQVEKVFFGKIDTNIVYLSPGHHLQVGETYLVYGHGNRNHFYFGGPCDLHSKQVPNGNYVTQEEKTLSEISDIMKKKLTCYYTIQLGHHKLAEGFYENGKPAKIWKHYYWNNGYVKVEYDFTNNSEIHYHENGLKNAKIERSENETTLYQYSTENNDFLKLKYISKKTEYGDLVTWFFYYDNGNLQKQYSEKSFGHDKAGSSPSGEWFDYQEYYDNGKIKAKGSFFEQDSVGTWYFYNEKGKNKGKKDYKNIDTLHLLTMENEWIEINKSLKSAPTFIYGKITDKNTNKGIEEAYISLFRRGNSYFTAQDVSAPDGSYGIRDFPSGAYEVRVAVYNREYPYVSKYKTVSIEVEIKENEDVKLDIQLE